MLPRFREVVKYWRTVLRSGVIGVVTGILPGVGEDSGAWMSYAAAKAASPEREQFGKGSIDGLMAAETGDMSAIPGGIIPALALGIPGSAPSAVLMAAMIIHGIQPGPMLMIKTPQFIYDVVAMTTLATFSILFFGLFLVRPLLLVLRVPRSVLMPIIFVLCTVGAFAIASRLFDVYAMLAIGIGAFFLRRRGYEMAPFVLGLVLGRTAGQEPAPRPGAVRRQHRALLHASDLRGAGCRHRSHDAHVHPGRERPPAPRLGRRQALRVPPQRVKVCRP